MQLDLGYPDPRRQFLPASVSVNVWHLVHIIWNISSITFATLRGMCFGNSISVLLFCFENLQNGQ
jgi:hypothetical protein